MHIDSPLMIIRVPLQTVIDCSAIDMDGERAVETSSYNVREFELRERDGDVATYYEI